MRTEYHKNQTNQNFPPFRNAAAVGTVSVLTDGEKLKRHCIFRSLIAELRKDAFVGFGKELSEYLEISFDVQQIEKLLNLDDFSDLQIYDLGVCRIPGELENIKICTKLAKVYGSLSVCSGFRRIGEIWRLDVDERLSRSGFLIPVKDRKNRIYALKVYRNSDDPNPFILSSRGAR